MRWLRGWTVVAVFAVLDLVVVGLALYRMERPADAATTDPSGAVATTTPSASASLTGPVFLAATDGGVVLRATRGSCDAREPVAARVWATARSGASLALAHLAGLQEALGVRATPQGLTVVGADSGCHVRGWTSTDAGATWTRGTAPRDTWYLDTDTTKSAVHGPMQGGVENLDCTPVSVATLGDGTRALVSCSGSNLLEVDASPTVAAVSYVVTSPAAAAQPADGLPLALAELPTCTTSLVRVVSQQDARQLVCLSQDSAPLALAVAGSRVYAQVGERLLVADSLRRAFRTYDGG